MTMTEAEAIKTWADKLRNWIIAPIYWHPKRRGAVRGGWRAVNGRWTIEREGFVELIEAMLAWEADNG